MTHIIKQEDDTLTVTYYEERLKLVDDLIKKETVKVELVITPTYYQCPHCSERLPFVHKSETIYDTTG